MKKYFHGRINKNMEEGIEKAEKENFKGETGTTLQAPAETLPSTEFVKVEKNLATLGFFTPSSKRLRNAQEKSFTITTVAEGQRLELKGTIIPSAKYGLPITADQDKWIALCKILTDIIRKEGRVTNPVSFTSAEILRLLHKHRHSGKNYREIEEWLDVLFSTTIFSEGVVYLAREKRRVKDRFRVFDRAVSFGKELESGKIADKNYVWFSEWQLQNINSNHLLPIDLEAYRELKNHIAKALVPLLQVWLYATRDKGVFEKQYGELCEFLNIRQYRYYSLILQTLGPSLDELKQFGYLADWQIEKMSDRENYKIVFYHGEKFHRDRRERSARKHASDSSLGKPTTTNPGSSGRNGEDKVNSRPSLIAGSAPGPQTFDPQLVVEFTRRGITKEKALALLANLKPGQDVVAQLEIGDELIERAGFKILNPTGFLVKQIERNALVPEGYETIAKRKAREERERQARERRLADEARQELENEYEHYCYQEVEHYIEANPATFNAILEAKTTEERERGGSSWGDTVASIAKWTATSEIRKQLTLLTFEEFVARKQHGTDFSLKSVAVSPDATTPGTPGTEVTLTTDDPRQEVAANDACEPIAPSNAGGASAPAPDVPQIVREVEAPIHAEPDPRAEADPTPATQTQPVKPESEPPPPSTGLPTTESAMPDSIIADMPVLLVHEPPREEPDGNAAEEGTV